MRTCSDGVLSGSSSYAFSTCSVDPPANCPTVDGVTLTDGQSATFYQTACVDTGQTCTGQTRTCSAGVLSGSYTNATCSVVPAAGCTVGSVSLADGQSQYFHSATSVPYGSDCNSTTYRQYRTCSNGVMSGSTSYQYASCTVASAANCTFNGSTVLHGNSVQAWQAASASTCTGETRTCSNGTLSGSYTFASCTQANACTAQTKTWGAGCSASFPTTTTASATASNTASGYSGSATFSCNTTTGVWATTPSSQTCTVSGVGCPDVSKSWTVGGRTCTGPTGTGTHNQNKAVPGTNPFQGSAGTAYFLCTNGTWATNPSASPAATCAETTIACYCMVEKYTIEPYPIACEIGGEGVDTYMGMMTSTSCSNLNHCPPVSYDPESRSMCGPR